MLEDRPTPPQVQLRCAVLQRKEAHYHFARGALLDEQAPRLCVRSAPRADSSLDGTGHLSQGGVVGGRQASESDRSPMDTPT